MSEKRRYPEIKLKEPEQAIDNYLEALLRDVEEYRPEAETARAPVIRLRPVAEAPQAAARMLESDLAEPLQTEMPETEAPAVEATPEAASDVPDWAVEPFQCLLFRIRGMTLAVPLVALRGIVEWQQELTQLPGQPRWHMGLMLHRQQQVKVVDTACLLMPERLEAGDTPRKGSHLLLIGDGSWGLACDALLKPQVLNSDQVRWQGRPARRPWIAGTLVEQLCVLLDLEGLYRMIRNSTEER